MTKKLALLLAAVFCGIIIVFVLWMLKNAPSEESPSPIDSAPITYEYPSDVRRAQKKYLERSWPLLKQRLIDEIENAENATGEGLLIYNLQAYTNALLEYAAEAGDEVLLRDVNEIYSMLLDPRFLSHKKAYAFWDGYDETGAYKYKTVATREYSAWLDEEELEWEMSSAQFLYAVVRLAHALKENDAVLTKYAPVMKDFYTREVLGLESGTTRGNFTRVGWGCLVDPEFTGIERFNHQTHIAHLRAKRYKGESSTCNALDDTDNWLIIGTIEMLALDKVKPSALGLAEEEREKLLQYAEDGAALIQSHFVPDTVTFAPTGERFPSLHFEPGLWKDHPDNIYAAYKGTEFPDPAKTYPPPPATNSWDLSHATRLVQITETLHRNAGLLGIDFTKEAVRKVANQLTLATFNGTLEKPSFTNYINSDNGWFRVNAYGQMGFGYHPSAMSITFPTGGLCRFGRYQPEIKRICNGLHQLATTTDPGLLRHRREIFEESITSDYERFAWGEFDFENDDFGILTFYASL